MHSSSTLKALKALPIVIAIIILIMQSWLMLINEKIYKNSDVMVHLNNVQGVSQNLLVDLTLLRGYLTNEEQHEIDNYIATKVPQHKQWLKEIIYGQHEQHPLSIFSEKYLRLLKELEGNSLSEVFGARLSLFELVDEVTRPKQNITTLSRARVYENQSQLNNYVVLSELISVIIIMLIALCLLSIHFYVKKIRRNSYKAQKLAQFFSHYPNALIRLSSHGSVRYYNKEVTKMLEEHGIRKSELIPPNIKEKLNKVIKMPNKTVRFQHTIADTPYFCDIRLCSQSSQIYMMLSDATMSATKENDQQPVQTNLASQAS